VRLRETDQTYAFLPWKAIDLVVCLGPKTLARLPERR